MLINFNVNTFEDYKDFNCKDKLLKNYKVSLGVKREIGRVNWNGFFTLYIKEVKRFNTMRLNKSLSANKLIGVQEINRFIKDSISLDECKELINIKTRQYAKRQNTWARGHMKNWNKLYSKNFSILLKKTLKVIS